MPDAKPRADHPEPPGDKDFALVHVDAIGDAALEDPLAQTVLQGGLLLVRVKLGKDNLPQVQRQRFSGHSGHNPAQVDLRGRWRNSVSAGL